MLGVKAQHTGVKNLQEDFGAWQVHHVGRCTWFVAARVVGQLVESCAGQAVSRPLGVKHVWVHPTYFLEGTDREGVVQRRCFGLKVPLAHFPLELGRCTIFFLGIFVFFILVCSYDGHQSRIKSLSEACLRLKAVNELLTVRSRTKLFAPLEESYLVKDFALF